MKEIVMQTLEQLLSELGKDQSPQLDPNAQLITDVGLDSMDFAQLVAMLEVSTGVDPFASATSIADVRTIKDLVSVYERMQ